MANRLIMGDDTRIGRFNVIRVRRLFMRQRAYIGHMNFISGDFSVNLGVNSAIGNRNVVNRGPTLAQVSPSQLRLGTWSKITASHYLNVAESILFDEYSILAGCSSQMWTHGFIHMSSGLGREEICGKIAVGKNVYIGSQCCFNPGVQIGDCVSLGAHSSVATSLLEPGVYVSQPLRHISSTPEARLARLEKVETASGNFYRRRYSRSPRAT
jgi:acetyltransferase-like isoleucine patch superfamily enzyme